MNLNPRALLTSTAHPDVSCTGQTSCACANHAEGLAGTVQETRCHWQMSPVCEVKNQTIKKFSKKLKFSSPKFHINNCCYHQLWLFTMSFCIVCFHKFGSSSFCGDGRMWSLWTEIQEIRKKIANYSTIRKDYKWYNFTVVLSCYCTHQMANVCSLH